MNKPVLLFMIFAIVVLTIELSLTTVEAKQIKLENATWQAAAYANYNEAEQCRVDSAKK